MRAAIIASALLLSGITPYTLAWATPRSDSGQLQPDQEEILKEFKRALKNHQPKFLHVLVQRLKQRRPQPDLLVKVCNLLAADNEARPQLEALAILVTRSVFQQLSHAAQLQVQYSKLTRLAREFPNISAEFADVFTDSDLFFSAIRDAVRARNERASAILEVLFILDTKFFNLEAQEYVLNTYHGEERLFLLTTMLGMDLLSPQLRTRVQKPISKEIALVEALQRSSREKRRFDDHLDLEVARPGKPFLALSVIDPNRSNQHLHPNCREEYCRALAAAADVAILSESFELNEQVETALASSEAYTATLLEAIQHHDYAILLALVQKGKRYFTPEAIPLLMEISAQVQNSFLIHLCLSDLLDKSPGIWQRFSPETRKYILGILKSESLAETVVSAYFHHLSDEAYLRESRSHQQLVNELKPALRDFIVDVSKYPYAPQDIEVLGHYLQGQIAQGHLSGLNAAMLYNACVKWDANLRQKGLIPRMRGGF
jgi:hypothetical protein